MKKMPTYHSSNVIMNQGEQGKGYLVLGDSNAPMNMQYIKSYEIGAVISIGFETVPKKKFQNIKYHYLKLSDKKTQPLLQNIQHICSIIQKQRESHGVLIHCMHGVSRSASFTIAYTMKHKKLPFEQAKQFVKSKRPCVGPNQGFVEQLRLFQVKLKQQ